MQNLHGFKRGERAVRGADPEAGGRLPRKRDSKIKAWNSLFLKAACKIKRKNHL